MNNPCPNCGKVFDGDHAQNECRPAALAGETRTEATDHKFIADECHDHGCHFLFLQRGGKCSNCNPAKSVSATEFRKAWSHKPTPITAESSGLFYSEECTDELMQAYAESRIAQLREKITELVRECDQETERCEKWKSRAETAEAALTQAQAEIEREKFSNESPLGWRRVRLNAYEDRAIKAEAELRSHRAVRNLSG